jgi:hypothetical protein
MENLLGGFRTFALGASFRRAFGLASIELPSIIAG